MTADSNKFKGRRIPIEAECELEQQTTLEKALNALPDHIMWNGCEYALIISKCKDGAWQISYCNLEDITFDSFTEDDGWSKNLLRSVGTGLRIARMIPLHPIPVDD